MGDGRNGKVNAVTPPTVTYAIFKNMGWKVGYMFMRRLIMNIFNKTTVSRDR